MRAVTLAQLLESGKLAKLPDKQRIGILKQLGRALHAVQMGRMNHGTLCPELIYLVPGRGVQLLGIGCYNALDTSSELTYGQYQPEDHLLRGIASTSGDAFALARLSVQLLNRGKLDTDTRPSQLDDNQWAKLNELLYQRTAAEIQAPLQLVRELFTNQDETEVNLDAVEQSEKRKSDDSAASFEATSLQTDPSQSHTPTASVQPLDKNQRPASRTQGNSGGSGWI